VARELGLDPSSIIKLPQRKSARASPLAVARCGVARKRPLLPGRRGFHLRNAIAKNFGLGRGNVVLGNGSNEIIELLFHTSRGPAFMKS